MGSSQVWPLDASRQVGNFSPTSEGSIHALNVSSGLKKRKREGDTMDELLDDMFVVKACRPFIPGMLTTADQLLATSIYSIHETTYFDTHCSSTSLSTSTIPSRDKLVIRATSRLSTF
jgi:hypothetical protein